MIFRFVVQMRKRASIGRKSDRKVTALEGGGGSPFPDPNILLSAGAGIIGVDKCRNVSEKDV